MREHKDRIPQYRDKQTGKVWPGYEIVSSLAAVEKARIIETESFILAGYRMDMSMNDERTGPLWTQFMKNRQLIPQPVGRDLYSVQVYPDGFDMKGFTNDTVFTKWAATKVASAEGLPEGMHSLVIPAGKYAVFTHRGTAAEFGKTAAFIYGEWLPASGYALDGRPSFEVMGKDYFGHLDPRSEEDVWVPVRHADI
ncbi:MAG: GyrI-like domain-containing protein [Cyclobacteriaceae bacterium]